MTDEKVFKAIIVENASGKEPVHVRDLKILVEVVNQHAKYIEELIQRVKELEGEKKEADDDR